MSTLAIALIVKCRGRRASRLRIHFGGTAPGAGEVASGGRALETRSMCGTPWAPGAAKAPLPPDFASEREHLEMEWPTGGKTKVAPGRPYLCLSAVSKVVVPRGMTPGPAHRPEWTGMIRNRRSVRGLTSECLGVHSDVCDCLGRSTKPPPPAGAAAVFSSRTAMPAPDVRAQGGDQV